MDKENYKSNVYNITAKMLSRHVTTPLRYTRKGRDVPGSDLIPQLNLIEYG